MKNNRAIYFLIAFLILQGFWLKELKAQNSYVVRWLNMTKTTDWDYLIDVKKDKENNIYSIGTFTGNLIGTDTKEEVLGENDIFVVKNNNKGETLWVQSFTSRKYCHVLTSCLDNDGFFYVGGVYNGDLQVGETTIEGSKENSVFLIKLATDGHLEWHKTLHTNIINEDLVLTTDTLGNIYLGGTYVNHLTCEGVTYAGDYFGDIFLLGLNNEGKILDMTVFNGSGEDVLKDVMVSGDGLFLAGYFENDLTIYDSVLFSVGQADAFFVRYSLTDSLPLLVKQIGGRYNDFGTNIRVDIHDNIVFAGMFSSRVNFYDGRTITSKGRLDVFVCQYDSDGNLKWVNDFGGYSDEYLNVMETDSVGDIYVSGSYRGTIKKSDFEISSRKYSPDLFLAKLKNNGDLKSFESIGDTSIELGSRIIVGSSGNLYLSANVFTISELLGKTIDSVVGNHSLLANLYDCSKAKVIELPHDTALCGEYYDVKTDTSYLEYYWNQSKGESKYRIDTTGTFHLRVVDENGCESIDSIHVVLHSLPKVNLGEDREVVRGEIVELTPDRDYRLYRWSTNSTDSVLSMNTENMPLGTHWYSLIIEDNNECVGEDELMLTISDAALMNNFSMNIFPTPARNILNIKVYNIDTEKTLSIRIVTVDGNNVWQQYKIITTNEYRNMLDISSLSSGMYLIVVKSGKSTIEKKFTVL